MQSHVLTLNEVDIPIEMAMKILPYLPADIPIEMAMKILSDLPLEVLLQMTHINHSLHTLNSVVWQKRFELYFPHVKPDAFCYEAFRKVYDDEYKSLKPEKRKLFSLVKRGDIDKVKAEVTLDALYLLDINQVSLLRWAYKKGHQSLLDHFYQLGMTQYAIDAHTILPLKVDIWRRSALHWAIETGQSIATLELLLQQGCKLNARCWSWSENTTISPDPLTLAALLGSQEAVSFLLEKNGSDFSAQDRIISAIEEAAHEDHLDIVKLLISALKKIDPDDVIETMSTILKKAIKSGHTVIAQFIISQGVLSYQTPHHLDSPLLDAAEKGHVEIVDALLAAGVDIETQSNYGGKETALISAVREGHAEVAALLLAKGANTEAADHGNDTPLICAAIHGHNAILTLLLHHGANIEAQSNYKNTALTTAADSNHVDSLRLLIKAGANLEHVNRFGETALKIAIHKQHTGCVYELLKAGANKNRVKEAVDFARQCAKEKESDILKATHSYPQDIERLLQASTQRFRCEASASLIQTFDSYQTRLENIHYTGKIPKHLICPLSGKIMSDPITLSNGHTFDRAALLECYTTGSYRQASNFPCPMTGQMIDRNELLVNKTNVTMKDLLEKFVHAMEEKAEQKQVEKNKPGLSRSWSGHFNRPTQKKEEASVLRIERRYSP